MTAKNTMEEGISQADSWNESEKSCETANVGQCTNHVENTDVKEEIIESDSHAEGADSKNDSDADVSECGQKTDNGNPEIQTKVKRIGLAALILSMGILCSRLLGFVRDAVIAYQAGAGVQTDAYNAAFTLPDIMNHFLAGGTLSITFIPLFSAYLLKNDTKKAERLFSLIATTMGLMLLAACLICGVFAVPLVHLLFPKFSPEQLSMTVEMTRIILPGQLFHYLGALMMAVLMARGEFLPSALSPLIYNSCIILCGLLLGGTLGMEGFAVGAVVGAFLGPFLLPMAFLRKKIHYKPEINFKDADFKKYIYLTIPLILGVSLTTVDEWIGRVAGSYLGEGVISWLNYARRLVLVPIVLVGQAAGQAALPYLSQLAAKNDFAQIALTLNRTLKNVVILSMVMMGFFIVLADPMVSLLYERGQFTANDTAQTAMVLRILAGSIVFWTIQMVTVRVYYAAQSTWMPMLLSTIATAASLPVYYFLSKSYGLPGLAAASCIGMAFQAMIVVLFYRRKNEHFNPMTLMKYICLGSAFCLLTAAGSYAGLMLVSLIKIDSHTLRILLELASGGILGGLLAAAAAYFIIPDELKAMTSKVRRKLIHR